MWVIHRTWASLVAQLVKNPPPMWETWVWSLGWEDPLEKGTATHSSILAWRIPWTQSMGSQRVWHDWATFTFIHSNYLPKSRGWKKQGESDFAGENLTNTALPGVQGRCQGQADNLGFNTSIVRRKRQDPDRDVLYTMSDQHYSKLSRSWKTSSVWQVIKARRSPRSWNN